MKISGITQRWWGSFRHQNIEHLSSKSKRVILWIDSGLLARVVLYLKIWHVLTTQITQRDISKHPLCSDQLRVMQLLQPFPFLFLHFFLWWNPDNSHFLLLKNMYTLEFSFPSKHTEQLRGQLMGISVATATWMVQPPMRLRHVFQVLQISNSIQIICIIPRMLWLRLWLKSIPLMVFLMFMKI